jgi:DNA-binding response OmpR family regulator
MPLLDGIGFVRKVRTENRDIPVVMITAHTDKQYLFDAIDLHTEKYIVKPIELELLLETLVHCTDMIKACRVKTLEVNTKYSYNYDRKELTYEDESIVLNKKEIQFLEVLISHQERVVTYEELQDTVWMDDVMTDSALRSLVRNLRKKLPTDIVSNLSGVGYRLV